MYRNVVFLLVVYIHFYDFSNLTAFCTFCHIRIAFEFICDLSFKYSIGLAFYYYYYYYSIGLALHCVHGFAWL